MAHEIADEPDEMSKSAGNASDAWSMGRQTLGARVGWKDHMDALFCGQSCGLRSTQRHAPPPQNIIPNIPLSRVGL